jgi:hypothetical protein
MPVRLACVKPAASVRSEPGSNSQVGLETLNRLITTLLTRSHHSMPIEIDMLSAIHIANNDGVTFSKRVPPKSFVRSQPIESRSFLKIETRKDSAVHVSLSSSKLVKQPDAEASLSPRGRNLYV